MRRLQTDEDLARVFPIISQLRPGVFPAAADFIAKVREVERLAGYQLFCLEDDGEAVAVCGVQPMPMLYFTKCLWVSDLVTDENRRSKGYGRLLLSEIEAWAADNGYVEIALSSGVQRKDAHRFYIERMQYDLVSYEFKKKLVH